MAQWPIINLRWASGGSGRASELYGRCRAVTPSTIGMIEERGAQGGRRQQDAGQNLALKHETLLSAARNARRLTGPFLPVVDTESLVCTREVGARHCGRAWWEDTPPLERRKNTSRNEILLSLKRDAATELRVQSMRARDPWSRSRRERLSASAHVGLERRENGSQVAALLNPRLTPLLAPPAPTSYDSTYCWEMSTRGNLGQQKSLRSWCGKPRSCRPRAPWDRPFPERAPHREP